MTGAKASGSVAACLACDEARASKSCWYKTHKRAENNIRNQALRKNKFQAYTRPDLKEAWDRIFGSDNVTLQIQVYCLVIA